MPQLTKVSVSYGETRSYGNYSNRRAEATVEALIIEGEQPGAAFQQAWEQAVGEVKFTLNREERIERERHEREMEEWRQREEERLAAYRTRPASPANDGDLPDDGEVEADPDAHINEDDPDDDSDMPY